MGAEESIHVRQGGVNSLYELALLNALSEALEESQIPSEQFEHAWNPEDCSPKFRVLRDRLTARRLPSPLTTDAIRGTFFIQEIPLPQKQFRRTKRLVRKTIVSIRENEKEAGVGGGGGRRGDEGQQFYFTPSLTLVEKTRLPCTIFGFFLDLV